MRKSYFKVALTLLCLAFTACFSSLWAQGATITMPTVFDIVAGEQSVDFTVNVTAGTDKDATVKFKGSFNQQFSGSLKYAVGDDTNYKWLSVKQDGSFEIDLDGTASAGFALAENTTLKFTMNATSKEYKTFDFEFGLYKGADFTEEITKATSVINVSPKAVMSLPTRFEVVYGVPEIIEVNIAPNANAGDKVLIKGHINPAYNCNLAFAVGDQETWTNISTTVNESQYLEFEIDVDGGERGYILPDTETKLRLKITYQDDYDNELAKSLRLVLYKGAEFDESITDNGALISFLGSKITMPKSVFLVSGTPYEFDVTAYAGRYNQEESLFKGKITPKFEAVIEYSINDGAAWNALTIADDGSFELDLDGGTTGYLADTEKIKFRFVANGAEATTATLSMGLYVTTSADKPFGKKRSEASTLIRIAPDNNPVLFLKKKQLQ